MKSEPAHSPSEMMGSGKHTRESLEKVISALYVAANESQGMFRERIEPVLHYFRVVYFKTTGEQYHHQPTLDNYQPKQKIQVLHPAVGISDGLRIHD